MMSIKPYIPLCVPWWDEREALHAGAKYSENLGFHILADADTDPLWAWLPRRYNPCVPGAVLIPDMLPVTTAEQNIRHLLGPEAWNRIRKHAYQAAGYRCEICGEKGKLEAHEQFILHNETTVQELAKIMALCPLCHKVHHLGIARRLGMLNDVKAHMLEVNGWSNRQLDQAIQESYEIWAQRCDWPWVVDLQWLEKSGYRFV
jgi:hypothetical protein